MSDRRSFLRGLATLPLIGGSVAILGKPTAAAVTVTPELLQNYKAWLFYEHRMTCYEMAGYDIETARFFERVVGSSPPDWHFQWSHTNARGPAGWIDAPQPSTRAAVVLSAVGCPLTGAH